MENQQSKRLALKKAVSWAALVLALLCLAYAALYIPLEQYAFQRRYAYSKEPIPWLTRFLLSVDGAVFPVVAAAAGLAAFVLQWKYREQGGMAYLHLLLMAASFFALAACHEILWGLWGYPP